MRAKLRGTLRLGAGGLILAAPLAGHTATFDLGPVNAQVDTTLSVGATFRMQDQDDSLIGITNGGTARSVNEDDGNYGFEKGDTVAAVAKITTDLDFSWGDYGLFSRLSYFADPIAEDADNINDRRGPIAPFVAGPTNLIAEARERGDYELGNRGHQRQDDEFSLLDLFAYGNWDVGIGTLRPPGGELGRIHVHHQWHQLDQPGRRGASAHAGFGAQGSAAAHLDVLGFGATHQSAVAGNGVDDAVAGNPDRPARLVFLDQ